MDLPFLHPFFNDVIEAGYRTKHDFSVTGENSSENRPVDCHGPGQKNVDGKTSVTFVPPCLAQLEEITFFLFGSYQRVIINGDDLFITVLYDSYEFTPVVSYTA